jgi:TolB protein
MKTVYEILLGMLLVSAVVTQAAAVAAAQTASRGRDSAKGARASAALPTETIVYSTFRSANWDVYYFAGRDTPPRLLTDDPGLDYDAVFSPDGRWIVFCSERRDSPDLFVLDTQKGGPPRLLIESDSMEDQVAFSPDGKTIAFVSSREGSADIYVIPFRPTKTLTMESATRLTKHGGGEFRPAFSPDGKTIAFSTDWDVPVTGLPADRHREGEIYVMSRAGRDLRRLTNSAGWDGSPVWSTDGRTILFYSERDKSFRIWAMSADGSAPRAISPEGIKALSPTMAPGGRVAFAGQVAADKDPNWRIFSVLPDGTDLRMESDKAHNYWIPSYSPKGAMVCHGPGPAQLDLPQGETGLGDGPLLIPHSPAFVRLPDRRLGLNAMRSFSPFVDPTGQRIVRTDSFRISHHIAVSNLDGSAQQVIIERKKLGNVPLYAPVWSKDGKWIAWMGGFAFGGLREQTDVWKSRADGSEPVNLTPNSPGNDGFVDFSGDGRYIVFRSGRTGNFDIFLMNSDGTNVRNLTNHPAYDSFPAFSPLNDEIVFVSDRDGDLDEKTGRKTFELYAMKINADGSPGALRRLTDSPGQDCHAQYSPDGRWLVFSSERGGINEEEPLINEILITPQPYGELYAMRFSDGLIVRLTQNKWEDGIPSWAASNATDAGQRLSKR